MKYRFNTQDDIASNTGLSTVGNAAPAMYLPHADGVSTALAGISTDISMGINNFSHFDPFASIELHGHEFSALVAAAVAATPPSTPNLIAASDSGRSSTDNITKVTTPTFSGTAGAGNLINLYDNGNTLVGKAVANSRGTWSITSSALLDGTHLLSATATDSLNNVSLPSAALSVTIDTKAPVTPGMPDLIVSSDSGSSNTDNITHVSTPVFSGTSEAKARIDLFDTSNNSVTFLGSVVANSKGAWSITSSILTDGKHTVSAIATDVAGNSSALSTPLVLTIDTSAPLAPSAPDMQDNSDSGIINNDNLTNVVTPTFIGKAEAGSKVALLDDVSKLVVGNATANAQGEWSMTSSKLAEGTHNLSVTATDLAGNTSVASSALKVTIDTSAPLAPSTPDLLDSSDTGSSNTDNVTTLVTPTFSGKAEAGSTVALLDGPNHVLVGKAIANNLGEWSITSSTLAQGKHDLSASATDVAGNTSAASGALTVTIEAIAPTAPTTPDLIATSDSGAFNTDNITNVTAPIFSGTAQAGVTVSLYDGPNNTNLIGKAIASNTGAWSISSSKLGDGVHTLHATATDQLNNVSLNSGDLVVTIDTTAPLAASTPDLQATSDSGRSNTDNVTNVVTPAFSGTAEAGASVILLDNGKNVGSVTANSLGAWSITSTALLNGTHNLSASVTDLAGNSASSLGALAVTVDTIAPRVSINVPPITNDNTPTLSGTAEVGGGEIQLWNAQTNTVFDKATVDSLGNWSVTLPTITDGTYSVYATQSDLAGNNGSSIIRTGTIDTLAPVVSLSIPVLTNDNTPTITGTGEFGGKEIQLWNAQNNTVFATTSVDSSGHWNYTLPTTPDGTYSIYASQDDQAGNHGVSGPRTGTIDSTAPAVTLNIPALTNSNTPTISGTGEFGAGVINIWNAQNNTVFANATVDSSGHWSYTMPATPDGTYTVYASQDDKAGNHGTSTQQTGTIDTTAPFVTLNSFSAHGGIGTITGIAEVGGSQVDVYFNGAIFGSAIVNGNGTWALPVTSRVGVGSYLLTAYQHDRAGNLGSGSGVVNVPDLRGPDPLETAFKANIASDADTASQAYSPTTEGDLAIHFDFSAALAGVSNVSPVLFQFG